MKNKLLKFFKNLATFFVIVTLAFSNIPFNFLTSAIGGYIKTSNIVDQAWSLSQDDNVVDNLVSSYRNKNIALLDKLAGNLKINEAHAATSYVGGVTCARAGSTGTALTCSLTALTGGSNAAPSQNDIVIAAVSTGSTADRAIGVTNVGYTELPELYANGTTYDTNLSVSWKIMGATPDTAVNFSASGSTADAISAVVHVWRGVDTGTPFDVTNQSITGTATGRPNPPPITPITSGATVIAVGAGATATGVVYTAAGLSNFRTVASVDTYDSMTGMGSFAWTSGAYDSAQWAGGTANASESWASYALALRPYVPPADSTPPTPNPMTFATAPNNTSATQIDMTATTATDATTPPVSYYFALDTTACTAANIGTGAADSGWQSGTTYSDIGLSVNKCYGYKVKARDSVSPTPNETGYSGITTLYTSANTPSAPTVGSPTETTLVITNNENGNPLSNPVTSFAVQVTTADVSWNGKWVDSLGNASATAVWLTDAQLTNLTVNGLTGGTLYDFSAKARNNDGDETGLSTAGSGTTSAPAANLTISQTAGAKVSTKGSGAVNEYAHDTACTGAATCAAFTLASAGGTTNVTSIKITESGSVTANNELSDVNLYYDFDGNWSDAGAETLFGTAATLAADQTATITGTLAINTGQTAYIYVRYDLANGATYPMGGATANWQIATAGDVVSDGTESGSGTLAGTQTVLPVADSVTYVVGGDGGRSGDAATISGKGFGAPSLDADQQDCVTATVGGKGCARFIVGGSDTVEGADISTWNNTTITFTVSAAGLSATYGGASALEVVAAGQSTATDLTYYIYPNVTGTVTDFTVSDSAREYAAGDNAANNNTADLKDGEIQIDGDHFGASAGTLTILGQSATPAVVGSRCGGSSWTATCITAQVPATIGDGAGGAGDYTGNVVVTRTGALNDTLSGFRILPRITSPLTPDFGPNGQSTTIAGNHLCQTGTCPVDTTTWNSVADDGYDVEWLTTDATVTVIPTHISITANAPSLADGSYAVTVTTGGGTSYTSNELTFTISNNASPTLSISAPPAGNTAIAEGSTYNVTYALADTDNVVTAAFYYETDGNGSGGTAITGCGTLGEAGTICSFNTSVLTPGTAYYVYGVTSDGVNPTVTTVSSGTITVNDAPMLPISAPPAGNTDVAEGSSYNVTYALSDPDSTVTATFYYETDGNGSGGTAIAGCGAKAEGTTSCSFNTSVLTPGTAYYVYGVTSGDSVNAAVTTVSSGTITVNDAPTLSVSQPDGVGDTVNVGDLYNITYTLADTDNVVTSAFYWDTNNDGVGGTAITGACASAGEAGTTCSWDTTGMTAGSYYVYGVTSGDSVNVAVTAVSPGQITINELPQVTADTSGTQATNLDSGATGQYIGAAFRFRQNSGTADTVTALTLSEKNASFIATTGLTNAMIRYETNMVSCTASPIITTGTLAKSGVSFNASDQAVFSALTSNIPVTVGANYTCVYLFFNVDSSASGGKQIEMELSASSDFTLQNSTAKAGTYPALLSGTTTIRPNVTGYTNNTEGTITDGAREGNSITINGAGLGGTCDGTNTKVQIGTYTLSCTGATFNNTSITITVDTGLPDTNDGGTGANGLLVTIGGTADDVRQTFYAYPTITGIADDFANLADDAREYSAGDSAANNSTADLKDGEIQIDGKHFGASGTVTIHGVTATQAIVGTRCSSSAYTATCITVQVPTGISDSSYVGSIVVERTAGINNTYSGFRILPRITSISPSASGVVGDSITVIGNHLCQSGTCPGSFSYVSPISNVLFGATNASNPTVWSWGHGNSSTSGVDVKVPSGSGAPAMKVITEDYESNTTNFTYVSTVPTAPTTLQQFRSNGVTEITVGGGTNDTPTQAKMEGDFTAETSITAFLEVEVKPKASAFDGTTNIFTSSPSTGSTFSNMLVSISGLSDGDYHWRARAKNQTTLETSAWVAFGSNPSGDGSGDGSPASVDFAVDTTAPVISGTCIVSPTSSSCDGTSQTDIQAQIRWATDENASRQVAYQTGSCGTGADAAAVFNIMTSKEPSSPTGSATAHNAILSGLSPVTTYYYKIRAADALGTVSYSPAGTTCDSFQTDPAQTRVMKTLEFFIDQNTAIGGTLNKAFDVFISESKQDRSNIYIKSVSVDIFGVSVGDGSGNISVAVSLNGGGNQTYTLSDPGNGVASSWRTTYATSSLSFDCAYCTTHPSNTLDVSVTGPTNTSLLGAKASVTYYYEPL